MAGKKRSNLPKGLTSSKAYVALKATMVRQKQPTPGVLASLWIEIFVTRTFHLNSTNAELRGICGVDEFTKWRNRQRDLGNLTWPEEKGAPKYAPGEKIEQLLERVEFENGLTPVVKGYVDRRIAELDERFDTKADKSEVELLRALIMGVIDRLDHPADDEKYKAYSKAPDRLFRLITIDKQ